ncbi:hypothetical protein RS022_06190 [Candidatus Phytoplasma rubi]|uniref:Uncharacterized protein n=1 Tax=Candidatus Phytoplasma rubi TaxID=399025 RepID=A0ABY7BUZ1_9MOLU|nr:hypothetical protein [Candidatus Phytoplasma rubi]WAN63464.1 hypothetical protein RS022_06190 [Candidatus Phytoplasma rubi]
MAIVIKKNVKTVISIFITITGKLKPSNLMGPLLGKQKKLRRKDLKTRSFFS